jgi:hypothetical protein
MRYSYGCPNLASVSACDVDAISFHAIKDDLMTPPGQVVKVLGEILAHHVQQFVVLAESMN